MGIRRVDADLCRPGCGICVEECPYDVLEIDGTTGKAMVRYADECNECYYLYFCAKGCPTGAIETSPEVAVKRWYAC